MNKRIEFPYRWTLKDSAFSKNKGTVFSCFSGGGGSTMGYKIAGFDVLGCVEIDSRMMDLYKKNHNPKYSFCEKIQEFKERNHLPKELYELDVLDGSPPCSSFSMAGNRAKDWGKKKKFREGQAEQVLDTLFFDFIDVAKKLQPKVVVAENVKGLLFGEAINYVRKIYDAFDDAGYHCEHFLLNSAVMGVPQRRERVFFICVRKDLCAPIVLQKNMFEYSYNFSFVFNEKKITFGEIRDEQGVFKNTERGKLVREHCIFGDRQISHINKRINNTSNGFNARILYDDEVCSTIIANCEMYRYFDKLHVTDNDIILAGTFPTDYDFMESNVSYVVGMSVPPVMMAHLSTSIYKNILTKTS